MLQLTWAICITISPYSLNAKSCRIDFSIAPIFVMIHLCASLIFHIFIDERENARLGNFVSTNCKAIYNSYNIRSLCFGIRLYLNQKTNLLATWLPVSFLHTPGASGTGGLVGSFTHSNPSSHEPQLLLILGLKHGPHASPSFFLAGASYEKITFNYYHLLWILHRLNVFSNFYWYKSCYLLSAFQPID